MGDKVGVRLEVGVGVNVWVVVSKTSVVAVPVLSCATADSSNPGSIVAVPISSVAIIAQPLNTIEKIIIRDRKRGFRMALLFINF
ncbi:MAG TPA: hypothetical protein VFC41_07325 [Anaerovoracaceae bacterium]|nr:hypothetical protein [Anaerovoracaceae bacterium]